MNRKELINQIKIKKSFLSIGLDTDIDKIPKFLLKYKDPVLEFNKQIVDATKDLCISYKLNTAFYECRGLKGWESLIKTWKYLPEDVFSIADAKRGDIGNTSEMYAKTFFDSASSGMNFHSVTVAPYMGKDSVNPFLSFKDKWVILLALTSNEGGKDFQLMKGKEGYLFEKVIKTSLNWASKENLMYVVGATKAAAFSAVRKIAPEHFLLVPGVGAQGGSLQDVCKHGLNKDCGLIINSSRAIIYASEKEDFAEKAREQAMIIKREMEYELDVIGFLA